MKLGEFDQLSTEWNQAMAYQKRLDDCCYFLNSAKISRDYASWTQALWAFYIELSSNLHDQPRKVKGELEKESEQQYAERLIKRAERSLVLDDLDEMAMFARFVDAEKYLRAKMRERGLLLPGKQNPGAALSGDKSY